MPVYGDLRAIIQSMRNRKEHGRPRALQPGDLVAVVAPASRPDPEALEAGIEALRARSLRVQAGRHVLDAYGHLAGQDRDRAADLMGAFLDPEVRGIFCARGGSGSARTFPYLDLSAIAAHPKVFVGYSDVTVLHLAIARAGGWPTFYGPMVASEMEGCRNDACFDALWRLIACPEPAGSLSAGSDVGACRALVPGVAEGRLTGGTLCLVESSLGTPYSIRTRGRILALEDENEASWRVDRMLTHLVQSGLLEGVAGFLIGSLSGDEHGGAAGELSVTQSLRDHLGSLGKPVLCGFPFGHIATPLTLPLGVRCRLDAGAGTISALEPAVDARA